MPILAGFKLDPAHVWFADHPLTLMPAARACKIAVSPERSIPVPLLPARRLKMAGKTVLKLTERHEK